MGGEGVSIIVCCFNSEALLEETLKHIAAQQLDSDLACEVILVDNASTDNTQEAAKAIWSGHASSKINLVIAYQPEPGLMNARKKGINEAQYEYLVFCDDDNWLDEHYAANVFKLFNQYTKAAILGGVGIAQFEDQNLKPSWFDNFYHGYAVGEQAEKERTLNSVYGAGMAIRKSIIKRVLDNGELFLHDRKQTQLSSGGDTELCFIIRREGYEVLYSPQLTFRHFLTNKRLTWDYLKKLHTGFAKSHVVLNLYEKALNSERTGLSYFYWLKKGMYYCFIYLRYWPKHYAAYRSAEGTTGEIHHITWKNIAVSYFQYNFKTIGIYNKIIALGQQTTTNPK